MQGPVPTDTRRKIKILNLSTMYDGRVLMKAYIAGCRLQVDVGAVRGNTWEVWSEKVQGLHF